MITAKEARAITVPALAAQDQARNARIDAQWPKVRENLEALIRARAAKGAVTVELPFGAYDWISYIERDFAEAGFIIEHTSRHINISWREPNP
jgi:hypothetical protein